MTIKHLVHLFYIIPKHDFVITNNTCVFNQNTRLFQIITRLFNITFKQKNLVFLRIFQTVFYHEHVEQYSWTCLRYTITIQNRERERVRRTSFKASRTEGSKYSPDSCQQMILDFIFNNLYPIFSSIYKKQ